MERILTKTLLLLFSAILFACGEDEDNSEIVIPPPPPPVSELDGLWRVKDYWVVQFDSDKAYLVMLDGEEQQRELRELLKDGDIVIRNIEQTGENSWTGEEIMFWSGSKSLIWIPITYMLSVTGNELVSYSSDFGNITYHRVGSNTSTVSAAKSTRLVNILE